MTHVKLMVALALAAFVAACAAQPDPSYRSSRPLPPAQDWRSEEPEPSRMPATSAIGKIAGRQVGGDAATFLTSGDRALLEDTTQSALERGRDGQPTQWVNPQSGNRGAIVPQPRFAMDGQTCREYQHTIIAGGSSSTGYGTACRNGRGVWTIAENG
ncbi:MAG: RT0821/Lpp0805 family surface protein [Alphaproteobacteria bacterium]